MIVLIMGPTGAGKTTIGSLLAAHLGWEFVDGDSFHPPANLEKMKRGIPLGDEDRHPWLKAIRDAIAQRLASGRNAVFACSALKRSYREHIGVGPEVQLVYLKGSYDLIRQRLRDRKGHFATEEILAGQFADLEEPADAVIEDIRHSPEEIVASIRSRFHLA